MQYPYHRHRYTSRTIFVKNFPMLYVVYNLPLENEPLILRCTKSLCMRCYRADAQRVMHTDGGRLIAIGSHDRKVRLIDNGTCREVKPCITGHAGSVRSLALCEERGFVVSGSFDTSIRYRQAGNTTVVLCKRAPFTGYTDAGNYKVTEFIARSNDNTCGNNQ